MKALSTTILIVVTAVVILVAALVVLTIFGGGVGNVAQMTDKRNNCLTQCTMTCKTMGQMPPAWDVAGGCGTGGLGITASQCGCGTSGTTLCASRTPTQCTGDCFWCSGKGCVNTGTTCP